MNILWSCVRVCVCVSVEDSRNAMQPEHIVRLNGIKTVQKKQTMIKEGRGKTLTLITCSENLSSQR